MTEPLLVRPRVTLKLATSLDGKIATRTGDSKWITGEASRARVHAMRAAHDCVLTGIGTVLADDPELTARMDPASMHQPLRCVLDSKAQTPLSSKLMATIDLGPVCLFHDHVYTGDTTGAKRYAIKRDPTGLNLRAVLATLQDRYSVTSVMIEAGAKVAGAFLKAGLVDRIVWFRAPIIIGGDGLSVFGSIGVDGLDGALAFDCTDITRVGQDSVETYIKRSEN
jgi:diaminohydroxyphosphoribosylaminopyrimidine deaminase / 5-amino-6-(5-phosphoribosylamino)uracil reductase